MPQLTLIVNEDLKNMEKRLQGIHDRFSREFGDIQLKKPIMLSHSIEQLNFLKESHSVLADMALDPFVADKAGKGYIIAKVYREIERWAEHYGIVLETSSQRAMFD